MKKLFFLLLLFTALATSAIEKPDFDHLTPIGHLTNAPIAHRLTLRAPELPTNFAAGTDTIIYDCYASMLFQNESETGFLHQYYGTHDIYYLPTDSATQTVWLEGFSFYGYLEGTVTDNNLYLPSGQYVAGSSSGRQFYAGAAKFYPATGQFEMIDGLNITLNRKRTKIQMEEGENCVVCVITYDLDGNIYMGQAKVYGTQIKDTVATVPADAVSATYKLQERLSQALDYRAKAQIAVRGNEVWLQGMDWCFTEGYVKGTINEQGNITVPTNQYMGVNYHQPHRVFAARLSGGDSWTPEFQPLDAVTFTLDAATGSYTLGEGECLLFGHSFESPEVYAHDAVYKPHCPTPLVPLPVEALAADDDMVSFGLPLTDAQGNELDPDDYYWRAYIDGELFTFTTDQYNITRNYTDVPSLLAIYGDNGLAQVGCKDGQYFMQLVNLQGRHTVGIQTVYKAGGEENVSPIETIEVNIQGLPEALTTQPEGQLKVLRQQSDATQPLFGQIYLAGVDYKAVKMVERDDSLFICNVTALNDHGDPQVWLRGVKTDGKAVFRFPQVVAIDRGETPTQYLGQLLDIDLNTGVVRVSQTQKLTFTPDDNGTWTQDGEQMIGMMTPDGDWTGYGDFHIHYLPFDEEPVSTPENVAWQDWTMTDPALGESIVKVGLTDNDLYIKGIYQGMEDAVLHGTIAGDKVSFDGPQYLGIYDFTQRFFYFTMALYQGTDEQGQSSFQAVDCLTYNLDLANGTLTSTQADQAFLVCCPPDATDYPMQSFVAPSFTRQASRIEQLSPESPVVTTIYDLQGRMVTHPKHGLFVEKGKIKMKK